MAVATADASALDEVNNSSHNMDTVEDPFLDTDQITQQSYVHRFSSRFELENIELVAASSPSQVKRVLEAHLLETERRLQDTHKLGTSLLQQQSELQDKLHEVEQQQDEAEISPELKQRLASIGREHDDVSREIARSLLAPKTRPLSTEENSLAESTTLISQATGSPTKISAPSRRQRNQPTNRAGDLQFAADISTSLLAQVRQLQAAVAERDDAIKAANAERFKLEQDVQVFAQKLRSHDENEQRYKDESWNLEAQNHELLSAQREATDKEKRMNAAIALANAEKLRLVNEVEEFKLAYNKALEEHEASQKAHETELHSLKRDFDSADSERSSLQNRFDELTAQNQELARAMASRFRNQSPHKQPEADNNDDDLSKGSSTPDHSPPPSPTKATPRPGGLESETLRSSLHHAQRMIQNLKSNIHREKTEKIELKRMLQDLRDELEQRRTDGSFANGTRKQKPKADIVKKPVRADMLGGSRRERMDIEMQEDDWEDQIGDNRNYTPSSRQEPSHLGTDMSDAYQTAHETESNFETADERMTTESEAFETGAESLAGDSTDDLTETESTTPYSRQRTAVRHVKPSLASKAVGSRESFLSTASTSAGEEDDYLQTPVQSQPHRFRLRNGRSSSTRQAQGFEDTPDSVRTPASSHDSPATITNSRSPAGVEQSLFAELEGINDTSSTFSTPARSTIIDLGSTPGLNETPSKFVLPSVPIETVEMTKPTMIDTAMMTEPWQPEPMSDHMAVAVPLSTDVGSQTVEPVIDHSRNLSIGESPLPLTAATSLAAQTDVGTQYTPQKLTQGETQTTPQQPFDVAMQYTPSRSVQESPTRNGTTFITPPRTVWDTNQNSEFESPRHQAVIETDALKPLLGFSDMSTQATAPLSPEIPPIEPLAVLAFSDIISLETPPIASLPSPPPTGPLPAIPAVAQKGHPETDELAIGTASGGLLAGAAAALGLVWGKQDGDAAKALDSQGEEAAAKAPPELIEPTQDQAAALVVQQKELAGDVPIKKALPTIILHNDQSSQTMLTSAEIEHALRPQEKPTSIPVVISPAADTAPAVPPKGIMRSPDLAEPTSLAGWPNTASPPPRPSSSSSWRSSATSKQHPPLPHDYKTNIARANSLVQNQTTTKKESNTPAVGSVMGPPLMPASAMRRPKTPTESTRSPTRENATPRFSQSIRQRGNTTAESHVSRRSSISSFASEVDERFNIRAAPGTNGYEPAPGTDPRMIQAITQTMIGEYLWKYTRKTGSKEMSSTRHRRYFWVHPYNKTLYWSTTDPSLPGSKESVSRSVPIESIRVVTDDNPMPPGLHRKSLEVTTPSRKVKFTASTSQRHETWFNALSYLLLRGDAPDNAGAYSTGGNEITRDDIDEFRVSAHDPHLVPNDRVSMSSYNSRTTAGTTKRVSGANGASLRQSLPSNMASTSNSVRHLSSRTSSVPPISEEERTSRADQPREGERDRTTRATSVSRVSRMLGSITGRSSGQGETDGVQRAGHTRGISRESNSIYNASVVSATRDSAEETRQEMVRQEAMGLGASGGLENVRACCDGKHDVSTLNHTHQHSHQHRALSSMSDRINRSMSRRI